MALTARRVIKIGGSLLSYPTLCDALRRWHADQPTAVTLVVVGGGKLVDAIAEQQAQNPDLDDVAVHWLAIRAMQRNAQLLADVYGASQWIDDPAAIANLAPSDELRFVDPWAFMQFDARGPTPLPASWDVSSDSIAARLAEFAEAEELVLLKSALPARSDALADYVDVYFAEAARSVKSVRAVNLRDSEFAELTLRSAQKNSRG